MAKDKSDLDGWVLPVCIGGALIGGGLIGLYVIPEILKVFKLGEKPSNPTTPETMKQLIKEAIQEQQPKEERQRLGPQYMIETPPGSPRIQRLRPKYLHSSARHGEETRQVPKVPQRSYRHQISELRTIPQQQEAPKRKWTQLK